MVSAVNRLPRKKRARDSKELKALGFGLDLAQDERTTLDRGAVYQVLMQMGIKNLAAFCSVASLALADQATRK